LPLFDGIARLVIVVAVSMNRSSVGGKAPHVDPGRRALVDPSATFDKQTRADASFALVRFHRRTASQITFA
jgi:hypothetical protein